MAVQQGRHHRKAPSSIFRRIAERLYHIRWVLSERIERIREVDVDVVSFWDDVLEEFQSKPFSLCRSNNKYA